MLDIKQLTPEDVYNDVVKNAYYEYIQSPNDERSMDEYVRTVLLARRKYAGYSDHPIEALMQDYAERRNLIEPEEDEDTIEE